MQNSTSQLNTASLTLQYFKVPVVITIAGVLASILVSMWVLNTGIDMLKRDFSSIAATQTEVLQRDLDRYKNEMMLLRGFFQASSFVSQAEFIQYTQLLLSNAAFSYAAWAKSSTDQSYEFIYQKGKTPQGFTKAQLPDIDQFDKKGMMFHSAVDQSLLLIAIPVKKRDGTTGLVIGAVSLDKLLKIDTIWVDSPKSMSVYFYKKEQQEKPFHYIDRSGIIFSQFGIRTEAKYAYQTVIKYSPYFVLHTINYFDQEWQVVFVPTLRYLSDASGILPWIILLTGLITTALLSYTAFRITGENVRISEEVKRKTYALSESQKLLKDREIYLHAIIENVPSVLFVKDGKELRFTEFNKAGRELIGVSYEEMIGKNDADRFPKEQAEFFISTERDILDKGELQIIEAEEIETVSGKKILYTKKVPIVLSDNRKFLLGISEDITERKETEEQRERLVDRLTDSNIELERFAYVASHDLQEPLRMIRSFSTKLQTHIAASLENDEKGQRYFKYVTEGAERAQNLIQDILNFSSISHDAEQHQPVDINLLVHVIRKNLLSNQEEFEGSITTDEMPYVSGNKTQLYQLLQNLIVNGLKYRKPNINPHVHVGIEESYDQWKFSIKDNGIGIEERHFNKIFDIFRRLHRKEEYVGTGIGLAICKKIVERHGGEIWVESKEGEGSTFYFTIKKTQSTGDIK